jgi:bifunctional non-homologous end joining protein LigD
VQLKNNEKNWLLIKHKDEYAVKTIYDAEKQNGTVATAKVASIRSGAAKKMNSFIKPMLASVTKTPFDDKDWLFEIKWDGYRAIAEIEGKKVKFYSRNGIDFSSRFPSIAHHWQRSNTM